jgi:transcriptional regulator with XRE-family HTH domain
MQQDDNQTPKAYLKALLRRTKSLREGRGYTQAQMAGFLNIKVDLYKKYETRSALPHRFIETFCVLVGIDEAFFLTGKTTAPKKSIRRTA